MPNGMGFDFSAIRYGEKPMSQVVTMEIFRTAPAADRTLVLDFLDALPRTNGAVRSFTVYFDAVVVEQLKLDIKGKPCFDRLTREVAVELVRSERPKTDPLTEEALRRMHDRGFEAGAST